MMNRVIRGALLLVLTLTMGACCGAAAETKETPATCLKEKGCPEPEKLPACGDSVMARALAEVLSGAETLVGREVAVSAPLRMAGTMCTLVLCPAGQCCNRCGASLVLAVDETVRHLDPRGLFLYYDQAAPGGKQYSCGGDDSLICCSVRADGQAVVATGKLKVMSEGMKGKTYGLVNARLCSPALAVEKTGTL